MLSGYVPKNRKYLNGIKLASIWPELPRDVWIALTVLISPEDGSWCVYATPPVLMLNDMFICFPVFSSVIIMVLGLMCDSRAYMLLNLRSSDPRS